MPNFCGELVDELAAGQGGFGTPAGTPTGRCRERKVRMRGLSRPKATATVI